MFKKLTCVILSVITLLCCVAMTGCGKEESNFDAAVFYDGFEKWDSDMSRILLLNDFGKVSFNTEEEYIKTGVGSAKLQPSGGTHSSLKPTMLLPMKSEMYEYDYTDYTKVKALSFWIYNAQEEVKNVGVALSSSSIVKGTWSDRLDRTNAIWYSLDIGWNYIEYALEPQYLSTHPTFTQECVRYLCLEFEYVNPLKYTAPVYYLDDVQIHYSANAVVGDEIMFFADASGNSWEISDFEDQRQVLLSSVKWQNNKTRLSASVVAASKYNQIAKSGNNVLELLCRAGSSTESNGWPQLTFSAQSFIDAFAAVGEDLVSNPQNYAIKFDYYNASFVDQRLGVIYTATCADGTFNPWVDISAKPYEWGEYSLTLDKIQAAYETYVANERTTVKDGFSDASYLKYPGTMVLSLEGFGLDSDLRERVLLFDNIRLVKIGE